MDNNIAAGTAQAGQSAAFSLLRLKPLTGAQWRAVARLAITLLLLALGAGLHLSSSGGHWLISPPTARADNIQYVYDELGRVIQATDQTTGQAVLYTYDAAGNITSQATTALTTLSIGYFTPNHGPIGTQVTITGTGFSATSSADAVTFNGVSATVVSATQTQLVVTVPSSATSGSIGVTVGGASATSNEPFTVTAVGDAPVITGLDPAAGVAGQLVTVLGTGFDSQPVNDRVQFNATPAQVTFSTSTAITTSVPAGSNSGKVLLVTPRGVAISPMDFIVVPSGYSASSIGTTGRMPTDGSTTSIAIPTANKIGVELFNGRVGDLLTIGVSSTTLSSATIKVFDPDGNLLTSGAVTASGQGVQLPALQLGGTYTIVVDPGSNTGNIALSIVRPFVGTLTLNGAATVVTLSPPGQRALLTFSGTQGTYANLSLSAVTVSAGTVSLIAPNGAVVDSESFTTSGTSLQLQLPATGTYTVLINPTGSVGGSLSVAVTTSSTPSLSTNQGYSLSLSNTTPVTVAFDGSAGQYLALTAATTASTVGSYSLKVLAPDGGPVISGTLSTSSNAGSVVLNMGPLPVGGTYSVVVQANSSGSGTVALTLSTPLTGVLAGTGSSTGASISTPGQGLLYTASLSAGQYASFALAESLSNPGRINAAAITVLRPDGTILSNGTLATSFDGCSSNPCLGATGYYGSTVVDIGPLPESGTYSFLVQQTGTGSLDTGTLTMTLSPAVSGTLVINSATNVGLGSPGQGLLYTFAGTAGQNLALGLQETNDSIPGVVAAVFNPDGTVLATGAMATTSCTGTGCPSGPDSGAGVVNLGVLPMTGTYSVLVLQTSAGNGTLSLALSSPVTGTLSPGPTANLQPSLPGQAMELTFSGTQGQYGSLALQEGSNGSIPGANLSVLNPDGSVLTTGTMTTTGSCGALTCAGYSGSSVVNFGPLPATGTYTVLVQQVTGATGALGLTLSVPTTGSLTVNTPSSSAASVSGQSLELSFNGSPGQYLAVGLQETYDNLPGASIKVLNPDGTVLDTGTFTTTACNGFGCPGTYSGTGLANIGPLQQTGTYNVLIQQTAAGTGTLGVTLSSPADGGALTPGTPLDVSASLLGQPLQVEFAGTADSSVTLHIAETSGSNISGATISVINPDGTPLGNGSLGASCSGTNDCTGSVDLYPVALPQTGTYTVLMLQKSAGTGTLAVTANGITATSGTTANYTTSTAGQNSTLTFSATIGQNVTLALTNLTLTPSSPSYVEIRMYAPNGAIYWYASCYMSSSGCENSFFNLSQTGTYSVVVSPGSSSQTMSFTMTVSPDATGALPLSTPTLVSLGTVGESEVLSFTASAGETVALNVSGITTTPANTPVSIIVYNSSGAQVVSATTSTGTTFNLSYLAAGTYRVLILPQSPVTGTMQVTLQPGTAGTLPATGTASSFTTSIAGQDAYLTFSATAGQSVALALTNLTLTPSSPSYVEITMYAPNGATYWYASCYMSSSGCEYQFLNLPQTGTYSVVVAPASSSQTMGFTMTMSPDATGALSLSTPTIVNLGTLGQSEVLSFTATTGETVALNVSGIAMTPANTPVSIIVYNSSGAQVVSATTPTGTTFNLPNLAADTYRVVISPQSPATGTMQVTLLPGMLATIPVTGAASNFTTSIAGQNVYLTFSATAGQSVALAVQNVALTPNSPSYVALTMYAPNGATYWYASCNTSSSGCEYAFYNLPQTGNYSLVITPASVSQTMSFTTLMSADAGGELSLGVPSVINLSTLGENEVLGFTTTAGETVALNIGGVTMTPANTPINIIVYNSSGAQVTNASTQTGTTFNLPYLAADTYRVFISPQSPATGTLQVTLQPGTVGTLPATGSASSFAISIPGQNAYLTFSAMAGQSVALVVQNVALTPSSPSYVALKIYAPNGATYWSASCYTSSSGCEYAFYDLPLSGTYSLVVAPASGSQAMSFTMTLSADVTGQLTQGTPLSLDLGSLGESAVLTFTATAGETVALSASGLTSTPANTTYTVYVYNSAGSVVTNTSTQSGTTLNLANLAAGTYSVWIAPSTPATASMQVGYQ